MGVFHEVYITVVQSYFVTVIWKNYFINKFWHLIKELDGKYEGTALSANFSRNMYCIFRGTPENIL